MKLPASLAPCVLVVGALTLLPSPSLADELHAARSQPMREISHSVELRIADGVAVYEVRRTFANNGTATDEARLAIDLPQGAAVTGMRIRASDRWYDADLLEREEAARRYEELTSMGPWAPKDPALLQWVWPDRMRLQIFPVLAGRTSTVEYTLTAPLHYSNGRYHLSYPRFEAIADGSLPLAEPVLRVDPGYGDATTAIFVDGQRIAPQTPVVLGIPPTPPWVGEGAPDPWVGYAWSELSVADAGEVVRASVAVRIDHTYRGDLTLELVTPTGEHLEIADPTGSENDIDETFSVELPEGCSSQGSWHLVVADHAGLDVGTIEAWSLELVPASAPDAPEAQPRSAVAAADVPVFIPDAPQREGEAGVATISLAPRPIDDAEAHLGRVVVDPETELHRFEIAVAPELGEIPRKPSVVFVLDASKSGDLDWQLDVAAAYLTHVPDASVEVVAFRRAATRVFDEFVSAEGFADAIADARAQGELELGNGSALEDGLQVAGRALRGRKGTQRVVVLSDALMRSRFELSDALDAIEGGLGQATLHLVIPGTGSGYDDVSFERRDGHDLASIPARTGGVLYELDGGVPSELKLLAAAALPLVRPVSIDAVRVRGYAELDEPDIPEVLAEGQAFVHTARLARAPKELTIDGKIWNRRFRQVVRADRGFSRSTAAFVFSEDEFDGLSDEQMMTVAMFGEAVSPVTSYLAVEPGVRPSYDGFEDLGLVGVGGGGGGAGYGGIGLGTVGQLGHAFTIDELIAEGVDACVDAHQPDPDWSVVLEVETTHDEVVDVRATAGVGGDMRRCVIEAAWALNLTWNFDDERESYVVRLG